MAELKYFDFVYDDTTEFSYSVDMLRFSCYIMKIHHNDFVAFLNSMCSKYWNESKFGRFSDNFKIGSFWAGLGSKSKKDTPYLLFCIEFNPNKMTDLDWSFFARISEKIAFNWTIRRFDLAIDMPYNILDLNFIDVYKKSYSIFYKDFADKTIYVGKGDGHIKIYNKRLESNLDIDLTRFEVTRECNFQFKGDYYPINFNFPSITFNKFIPDDHDSTLNALEYALNNGFPFNSLSRVMRSHFRTKYKIGTSLRDDLANKSLYNCLEKIKNRYI